MFIKIIINYRFDEAEKDCNRSLALDPVYIKALLRRATSLHKLNKLDLAVEDYNKVCYWRHYFSIITKLL